MSSNKLENRQIAALPWRRGPDGVEVMLVTSRETQRWVTPKGWPISGQSPEQSAATEAYEEAGVTGAMTESVGAFAYDKRLKDNTVRRLMVEVYPLEVQDEHPEWREAGQRRRQWFPAPEAAALVDEIDLARLILSFKP